MTSPIISPNDDFYFSVFSYIRDNGKLPKNNGSKQKINWYVQRLKKEGYISKLGYGVWGIKKELTSKSLCPQDRSKSPRNIRSHGFSFKVRLPIINSWEKRGEYLKSIGVPYKYNGYYHKIEFRGHKVWLCNKSIIIYYPSNKSYFTSSAESGKRLALYDLEQLLIGLENMLKCGLRINKHFNFRVSKQHYAKIKDVLAIQCNKEGVKVRCYYNGEGWLVIDNSFNLHELEADHPKTANVDMDKVILPVFNDYKNYYEITGQLPLPSMIMEMLDQIAKDRMLFAENMVSHVKAVQELSKGVNKLTGAVSMFKADQINHKQRRLDEY